MRGRDANRMQIGGMRMSKNRIGVNNWSNDREEEEEEEEEDVEKYS